MLYNSPFILLTPYVPWQVARIDMHSLFLWFAGRAPAPSTDQVLSRGLPAYIDEYVCDLVRASQASSDLAHRTCYRPRLAASRPDSPHLWGCPLVSGADVTRADAPSCAHCTPLSRRLVRESRSEAAADHPRRQVGVARPSGSLKCSDGRARCTGPGWTAASARPHSAPERLR
jgi:hypothetical protein